MKILFASVIGDKAGTIGGHHYTMQAMIEALSPHMECAVVSMGGATSPALKPLACPKYEIPFTHNRLRNREWNQFVDIVRKEKPDVIHAFDPVIFAFARRAARVFGCGILLTKCGGPNPEGRSRWDYFPQPSRLVVFSEENEKFFLASPHYSKMKVWRIPNRINEIAPDLTKIAAIRQHLDPSRLVLLRVGRMAPYYGRTAEMSIRLAKRLTADGIQVQLVFLGVVQDEKTAQKIRDDLGDLGRVISDSNLISKASTVLDLADMIVGTGRGLMEATARGKIVLVPARTGSLPTLVCEATWASLFQSNFSERSEVQPWDEEQNYADILKLMKSESERTKYALFCRKLYEEQFSLQRVLDLYSSIYDEVSKAPPRWNRDEVKNWLWMLMRTRNRPIVDSKLVRKS